MNDWEAPDVLQRGSLGSACCPTASLSCSAAVISQSLIHKSAIWRSMKYLGNVALCCSRRAVQRLLSVQNEWTFFPFTWTQRCERFAEHFTIMCSNWCCCMWLHAHCDHKPVHVVCIFVNSAQVWMSVWPLFVLLIIKIQDFQADVV